jgi:hexokinase
MDKVKNFLDKWELNIEAIDLEKEIKLFIDEMIKGLEGKESTLPMLPTFIKGDFALILNKKVVVIDAGGTNLRTCLVEFKTDLEPKISSFSKSKMIGFDKEVSSEQFFSELADKVEPLIRDANNIAFCFSYPALSSEDGDAKALYFSKEIKADSVIGMPLGASLLKELAQRGHNIKEKRVVVLNDTVATLLAGKANNNKKPYATYIGFILGTGTNTSYIEKNSAIKKLNLNDDKNQIINVEAGSYALKLGALERAFVLTTTDSDLYHFEKVVGGAYLGLFSHFVIEKAIEENLFSLQFVKEFKQIETLDTKRMSHYLEDSNNKEYDLVRCVATKHDDLVLTTLLKTVIKRAALFSAINICSAVIKSGVQKGRVCLNVDGSTFYKTAYLEQYTKKFVNNYLKEIEVDFIHIADSPLIGSAIAALDRT